MKTLHQVSSEIFDIVKKKELILFSELENMLGVDQYLILQSITKLKDDHDLIRVKNHQLSLSEKGLKHKSFDSYLKSLKKEPITRYQKIYLPLFILFGLSAMILGVLNHLSNKKVDSQIEKYNLLESEFVRYKDSVNKYNIKTVKPKIKLQDETSQTNNLKNSNSEKGLIIE